MRYLECSVVKLHLAAAVVTVVALAGCSDGFVEPTKPPLAIVDPSAAKLLDFNDAGQALWENEDGQAFLWDGSEVHQLPIRPWNLGPYGGVAAKGSTSYWKDGILRNIEKFDYNSGIDGQGRVYGGNDSIGPSWWTPDRGIVGEAPRAGQVVFEVGEDGSVVSRVYEGHDVYNCYRYTRTEYVAIPQCSVISITENGFLATSNRGTQLIDTRTDPWTRQEFEFESWDMNDHMVFTTTDGKVQDADGNVLFEVDAAQALINDNNQVLVMSPEGEIRIIEP